MDERAAGHGCGRRRQEGSSPGGGKYYDSVTESDAERYPDIGSYALIGDSRTAALVSRDGSVDWMCLPNFDSPSYFARLLDWDRGGYFRISPSVEYRVRRRYIDATNVLETTFSTEHGEVGLIDFMPAQIEDAKRRALMPLRALIRLVEARSGRVPMRLEYAPRPGYGTGTVELHARTRTEVTASRGRHVTHLRSDVPLDTTRWDARGDFDAQPGERLRFSLAYSSGEPAVVVADTYVDQLYEQTLAYWRDWSARCTYDGAYAETVQRSALTLKMLAFAPSGAIVAAPTMSLPEEIGGERNYDYRYCWIRDSAFTVDALLSIGYADEANAFVSWLMHATRITAPRLRPLYTLYGDIHTPEKELAHFDGYRGSRPVRIGNLASNQEQFDVYGELIDAFHNFIGQNPRKVDADEASFITGVANHVARVWREPDHGIWEARAEPKHYTHSKVMMWDALDNAVKLAQEGHITGDVDVWQREADEIKRAVLEGGYNRAIGSFTQTFDGANLDASLLVLPLIGFIDGDDPRMIGTIDAIRDRLETNGFLHRYEGFDDGLAGEEGAFLTCNFWLAAALASAGRVGEARRVFEHTMTAANDLSLLSEETDPHSGIALGNHPQGLSHIELITAALAITRAERGEIPHRGSASAK